MTTAETNALRVINKYIVGNLGLVLTEDQALALWAKIRAHLIKAELDETIPQIEASDGGLDTMERDDFFDAFAHVMVGLPWPLNGESEAVSNIFVEKMRSEVAKRGYF
jgi:hypothetical protein